MFMKQVKKQNVVHSEVKKDFKPKMVKGRTGWLVKGFVIATMLGVGNLAVSSDDVQASEWKANTAEMIRAKIKEGDTSYTFAEGDTFYEIGRAINVKYTVLMELNGFEEGSQYTVPVGTTITFDGRKVTLTDKDGNVVKEQVLSDDAKVDTSKPFMNQESDEIKGTTTVTSTSGGSQSTNKGGGNSTNTVKPKPVDPTKPVDPVDPVKPIDPVKPVDPVDPEIGELAKLKAHLVELEGQLVVAKQELATAEQDLLNAQNGTNVDYGAQIAELESIIADKQSQQEIVGNEIISLEGKQASIQAELATLEAELAEAYANQQSAQEVFKAAQSALDAIKLTGDAEQIANAEAALKTAKVVLDQANYSVTELEAVVGGKHNELAEIQSAIASKNEQLANLDTLGDVAKLAELKAQKEQQENNQQSIAELEKIVEEKQKAVTDLELKIEETKQKIATIELKVERANAIQTINGLEYLSKSNKNGYVNQVNSALDATTINAIVQAATNENEIAKAEYEAEEVFKKTKVEAINTINALAYLDADGKSDYIAIIESAENIETINVAVTNAKAEDNKLKEEFEDNKALAEAKKKAQTEVNGMEFLSADSKVVYNNQISDAKTVEAIAPILEAAKTENAKLEEEHIAAEALKQAKNAAKVEINALENLSTDQKENYNKQVEAAIIVEEIAPILEAAKVEDAKIGEENEAAKKLEAAKKEAIVQLDSMNLTDVEQADFTDQINAVATMEDINPILVVAKIQSDKNDETASAKELQEAKDAAKIEIAKLNLTADERAKFSKDVDSSKTISEVKTVTAKAQDQADKNTEVEEVTKKLAAAKANALKNLDRMNLKDGKSDFVNQVTNAKSVEEVNSVVVEAQKVSDKNTAKDNEEAEAAKKLEAARQDALAELDTLNLGSTKNYYVRLIKDAEAIDEINTIMAEAREVDKENNGGTVNPGENPIIDGIPKKNDDKVNQAKTDVENDIRVSAEAAQDLTNDDLSSNVNDKFLEKLNEERRAQGKDKLVMSEDENAITTAHIRAVTVMYNGVEHDSPSGLPSDGKKPFPTYEDGDTQFVGFENISLTYIPKSEINSDEDLANAIANAMFQQYIEEERNAALGKPIKPGDSKNPGHYNNLVMGDTDTTFMGGVYVVDMGDYYVVTTRVSAGHDSEYIAW